MEEQEILDVIDVFVSGMSAVKLADESEAPQAVLSKAPLMASLHTALRAAFSQGGLDKVDAVVDQINNGLKQAGSHVILGDGAALSHDAAGKPEDLMVTFCRANGDSPIASAWISLGP